MKNKIVLTINDYGEKGFEYKLTQKGKFLYTFEGFEKLFKIISEDMKDSRERTKDEDFPVKQFVFEHQFYDPLLNEIKE